MTIRIRITLFILMPIQIRIRIISHVLHIFEKQNFLRLLFTAVPVEIALPFSSALQV